MQQMENALYPKRFGRRSPKIRRVRLCYPNEVVGQDISLAPMALSSGAASPASATIFPSHAIHANCKELPWSVLASFVLKLKYVSDIFRQQQFFTRF